MNANKALSNCIGESFARHFSGASLLDSNRIVWKIVNDSWIGKRSVFTKDYRACWLEETTKENIQTYWCGKHSDYTEIFLR